MLPKHISDMLDIFNAEPTKLTKLELMELAEFFDLKLNMRQKEATMIKKITERLETPAEAPVVEAPVVEVIEPVKVEEVEEEPVIALGVKSLEADKVYKLDRYQRSSIRQAGQSLSKVPSEMTGAELMKFSNWKNLSL